VIESLSDVCRYQAIAYGDDARWPPTIRSFGSSGIGSQNVCFYRIFKHSTMAVAEAKKSFTPTSTYRTWFPADPRAFLDDPNQVPC
jgi:hypothetical protein